MLLVRPWPGKKMCRPEQLRIIFPAIRLLPDGIFLLLRVLPASKASTAAKKSAKAQKKPLQKVIFPLDKKGIGVYNRINDLV